jgi:hypothetical protein
MAFFFEDLGHQHAGARIIFNHHDQGHTGTLAALRKCVEGWRGTAATISTHRDNQPLDCHQRQSCHLTRMLPSPGRLMVSARLPCIRPDGSPRKTRGLHSLFGWEQELKVEGLSCE